MYVRFWGTRGSIATPGPQPSHYGGHTACVEVRSGDGTLIMLGNGHERQGHGFDCWQEVQGGGITDAPLAATSFDNRLYVFAKGINDNRIYFNSVPGFAAFGGRQEVQW